MEGRLDVPARATLAEIARRQNQIPHRKTQQDSAQRATLGLPSNMSQKPTRLGAKSNAWPTKQHAAKTNRTHRKEQRLVHQATCRKNQQDSPQRATLGPPSNMVAWSTKQPCRKNQQDSPQRATLGRKNQAKHAWSQKPTGLTAKSNAWSTKQHVAKTNRTHRKEQRLVHQATCRKNQQDSPQRATLGLPSNTSQKTNRTHRKEQRLVYQATCRKTQQDSVQRATPGQRSNMMRGNNQRCQVELSGCTQLRHQLLHTLLTVSLALLPLLHP